MYSRVLRHGQQVRRFTVIDTGTSGWEIQDQADAGAVRRRIFGDWHRVERAIALFESEQETLRGLGWVPGQIEPVRTGHAGRGRVLPLDEAVP
jgi:hypothetical protein